MVVLPQECDVVVDVGAVYDPTRHRYDHHQRLTPAFQSFELLAAKSESAQFNAVASVFMFLQGFLLGTSVVDYLGLQG